MDEKRLGTPLFIGSAKRRPFVVYHEPAECLQSRGSLIYIPPFAEEMNLSRRMAALQARMLATAGTGVLLLDLCGTGDSAGDFSEARWEFWKEDVLAAADWLAEKGRAPIGLWGLRLGGLLAVAVAAGQRDRFKHLLLWQPVTLGKSMLTQFLRIRVAASMHEGSGGETTERLRAELSQARSIEVAGYELSPELATSLDALRIDDFDLDPGTHIDWFEIGPAATNRSGRVTDRIVEAWRHKGVTVSVISAAGDQFWAIPEAAPSSALLSATAKNVAAWPAQ